MIVHKFESKRIEWTYVMTLLKCAIAEMNLRSFDNVCDLLLFLIRLPLLEVRDFPVVHFQRPRCSTCWRPCWRTFYITQYYTCRQQSWA